MSDRKRQSNQPEQPKSAAELYIPRNSIDMEHATLGAMFIEPEAIDKVVGILAADDFYSLVNKLLFEVAVELHHRHHPVDLMSMAEALRNRDKLDWIGGMTYLLSLFDSVPSAASVEYYAGCVKEKSGLRRLQQISVTTLQAVAGGEGEPTSAEIAEKTIKELLTVVSDQAPQALRHWAPALEGEYKRWVEQHENPDVFAGVPSSCKNLEDFLRGYKPGQLYILAGRPSMGKSALGFQEGLHAAMLGHKTAMFSLEMSEPQVIARLIANRLKVDLSDILNRALKQRTLEQIWDEITFAQDFPIYIDDTPSVTVAQIQSRARKMQAEGGLDFIIVDYLTRIKGTPSKRDNRVQEVGEIARDLKTLARELNVPVLCLAQLSRANLSRENKWPQMSDLRESGEIEQEADVVALVHRPTYYEKHKVYDFEPDGQPGAHYTGLLIDKNRNGRTGLCHLGQILPWTKFTDWVGDPPAEKEGRFVQAATEDGGQTGF